MKPGRICGRPSPVAGPDGITGHRDTAITKATGINVGKCSLSLRAVQFEMAKCRGGLNLKPRAECKASP